MPSTKPDVAGRQTITDGAALLSSIRRLLSTTRRGIVGIVGPPGAGKTHLARFVRAELVDVHVAVVPMDGFHLSNEVLEAAGTRQHKGRPDTYDVAGFVHLLDRLRRGERGVIYAPRFAREIEEAIAGAVAIEPDVDLVIVEGNYLLLDDPAWGDVAPLLDATYYVDVPEPVRTERLLARHRITYGWQGAVSWIATVDRPNTATVESTRDRADVIVGHFEVSGEPVH